jgi:hypothetical protein
MTTWSMKTVLTKKHHGVHHGPDRRMSLGAAMVGQSRSTLRMVAGARTMLRRMMSTGSRSRHHRVEQQITDLSHHYGTTHHRSELPRRTDEATGFDHRIIGGQTVEAWQRNPIGGGALSGLGTATGGNLGGGGDGTLVL